MQFVNRSVIFATDGKKSTSVSNLRCYESLLCFIRTILCENFLEMIENDIYCRNLYFRLDQGQKEIFIDLTQIWATLRCFGDLLKNFLKLSKLARVLKCLFFENQLYREFIFTAFKLFEMYLKLDFSDLLFFARIDSKKHRINGTECISHRFIFRANQTSVSMLQKE